MARQGQREELKEVGLSHLQAQRGQEWRNHRDGLRALHHAPSFLQLSWRHVPFSLQLSWRHALSFLQPLWRHEPFSLQLSWRRGLSLLQPLWLPLPRARPFSCHGETGVRLLMG